MKRSSSFAPVFEHLPPGLVSQRAHRIPSHVLCESLRCRTKLLKHRKNTDGRCQRRPACAHCACRLLNLTPGQSRSTAAVTPANVTRIAFTSQEAREWIA